MPLRYPPDITLTELDRDEVVVNIAATPQSPADGAQLAARYSRPYAMTARAERDEVGAAA